jgi:hypothetical protein
VLAFFIGASIEWAIAYKTLGSMRINYATVAAPQDDSLFTLLSRQKLRGIDCLAQLMSPLCKDAC